MTGPLTIAGLRQRVITQPRPKADVHVSFLNYRLGGAKFAYIGHLRLVRFRIPDRDAAEREVEMFISQKMDA